MSLQYLQAFFAEKRIAEQVYEVKAKGGTTNFICTADVIHALLNASDGVQEQAANILRRIDFHDGDVHHFFQHMAGAMAFDLEDMHEHD